MCDQQVFGLHPNADITYQTNMANEILSTIINIQPKDSGGGGGETREATVQKLANEMLDKLPPDYVPHEVTNQTWTRLIVSFRGWGQQLLYLGSVKIPYVPQIN